jgi:hypothetical protein
VECGRSAEDPIDPDSIAYSGPKIADFWRKSESPAFPEGNLRGKSPIEQKNSGRVWKNYTIFIVNLTAATEGQYLGCNHESTVIADPIDEIAARWRRERRLSALVTPTLR